eukprot:m.133522 g.133522  ORF g.133522 m.133522 type:complete len:355 (-) comp16513_c0_seq3:267-1331(-)
MAGRFSNVPPIVLDDSPSPLVPVELLGPEQGKLHWNNKTYEAQRTAFNEVRKLGEGRYGQVWLVQHREAQVELAVKRIQLKESMKQSLKQDLATIKNSHHINIVTFLGFNFTPADGELWIFMERAECSLDLLLHRVRALERFLPDAVVQHMALSSFNGLCYLLNEWRTMHRDVKPQNILMFTSGHIKLCDFGIAKTLDPTMSIIAKTAVGDPIYLPPERIKGETNYDDRSDVWALGLSIVQLALGTYPYPLCKSSMERFKLIVEGAPPVVPTYSEEEGPDTPGKYAPALAKFAARCMERNYEGRPHFADLKDDAFVTRVADNVSNEATAQWYAQFVQHEKEKQALADAVAAVKL